MKKITLTEAFAEHGATLKNKMWAYWSIAEDGSIVFCGWNQFLKEDASGCRYDDRLSRWHRPRDYGKNLWREHLELAFNGKLRIRLIVAAPEQPEVIKAGSSARNILKTFTVRKDVVGRVVEFDGDRFVIDFQPRT
jgi:hypothetical protein